MPNRSILNDQRQAGAAIEGVIRHEELDITQLAVDTHGHTDFAMALAKLLGFDLCPRLKALKDRHLFVPRGTPIPASVAARSVVRALTSSASARTGSRSCTSSPPCTPGTPARFTSRPASDRPPAAIRSTRPSSISAGCCAPCSCAITSSMTSFAASCCACSTAARPSMR